MLDKAVLIAVGLVLIPIPGLAASTSAQSTNPVGAGLCLGLAIAYLARRRPIGGWLLYFYLQLYSSFLVSLVFIDRVVTNLNPGTWDSAFLYVLFFLSVVPALLAELAALTFGTVLLFRRTARNVQWLRAALLALAVTSGISLGIDIAYFSELPNIIFDIVTLLFACVWTAYFLRSKRVLLVFIERAWDWKAVSVPRALTPVERRYLGKRAAIAGGVTFVLLLLMMGGALGDKKPDASIFVVPMFYALMAATAAWYSPIRKKKRDALLHASSARTAVSNRGT